MILQNWRLIPVIYYLCASSQQLQVMRQVVWQPFLDQEVCGCFIQYSCVEFLTSLADFLITELRKGLRFWLLVDLIMMWKFQFLTSSFCFLNPYLNVLGLQLVYLKSSARRKKNRRKKKVCSGQTWPHSSVLWNCCCTFSPIYPSDIIYEGSFSWETLQFQKNRNSNWIIGSKLALPVFHLFHLRSFWSSFFLFFLFFPHHLAWSVYQKLGSGPKLNREIDTAFSAFAYGNCLTDILCCSHAVFG